jgi:hypothetical protein
MAKPLSDEDATMLRLLKTPPKPFTPKAKKKPSPAKDKAKKGT